MFKRYAYWEKSSTGWGLTVYHDHKPGKSVGGADPERIGPFEVPQDMIDIDGSPRMGPIERAFPKPMPVPYAEPPIRLNQEEEVDLSDFLPDWAVRRSQEGVLEDMVQLITKDAKARGNATLAAQMPDVDKFLVVTDADNWTTYTLSELLWAYDIGPFILREFPSRRARPISTIRGLSDGR